MLKFRKKVLECGVIFIFTVISRSFLFIAATLSLHVSKNVGYSTEVNNSWQLDVSNKVAKHPPCQQLFISVRRRISQSAITNERAGNG